MEVTGFEVGLWKGANHSDGPKGRGTGEKDLHLSRPIKNKLSGNDGMFPVFLTPDLPWAICSHLAISVLSCSLPWWVQTTRTLSARDRPNQITLWQRSDRGQYLMPTL